MSVRVFTDHPVALESTDHLDALHGGAANDNSRNPHFNRKLAGLYPDRLLRVLDIGCAGGGFVRSLLDEGHYAVGLEGSDYCSSRGKFEWAALGGKNLFNCDVTRHFAVMSVGEIGTSPNYFDVVTAWEVMEHFRPAELPQVIKNVKSHLRDRGIWVMSVSEQNDGGHFHKTVMNRDWWLKLFSDHGLRNRDDLVRHFGEDWVRGPKKTEWAFEAQQSFHLILEVAR